MFTSLPSKKGPSAASQKNLTAIQPVSDILADEKRAVLLSQIEQACMLESSQYQALVNTLISNMVNHCQLLPESENNYYSQPGGLLDYALNRTDAALTLFKQFVILDENNIWSEEQILWQYALITAALLQGMGKLYLDFSIHCYDKHQKYLDLWAPLSSPLTTQGAHYAYTFTGHPDVSFRHRLNLFMARILMPPEGFAFIAASQEVFSVWLSLLDEDYYNAGTLGAILIRADALALQRYYNDIAIDRAQRKRSLLGRVSAFGGGQLDTEFDPEKTGIDFIKWVRQELDHGRLIINKAPLFLVPEGLLCLPEVFMMFLKNNPLFKNWLLVQKGFLSLGLHRAGHTDDPQYSFQQSGKPKTQTGVVLDHYATVLPEQVQVYDKKSGKTHSLSAINLVFQLDALCHLSAQTENKKINSALLLSANGKWIANTTKTPQANLTIPGSKPHG